EPGIIDAVVFVYGQEQGSPIAPDRLHLRAHDARTGPSPHKAVDPPPDRPAAGIGRSDRVEEVDAGDLAFGGEGLELGLEPVFFSLGVEIAEGLAAIAGVGALPGHHALERGDGIAS